LDITATAACVIISSAYIFTCVCCRTPTAISRCSYATSSTAFAWATTATIVGTSPATSDERAAVDQLCASGAFLNPLVTAVNALAQPAGVTRTAAAQANRTIRIVFTDTVNSRVTRVANITPPMARWCP
jgi:hypothetical protein